MPSAVKLREDYSAEELRAQARRSKDVNQSRRLLSLAAVRDGMDRGPAAKIGSASCACARRFGDYQEFRARGRFSSLADEPFAEDDGELGLGLEPLARRPFPFVSRVVQNQV